MDFCGNSPDPCWMKNVLDCNWHVKIDGLKWNEKKNLATTDCAKPTLDFGFGNFCTHPAIYGISDERNARWCYHVDFHQSFNPLSVQYKNNQDTLCTAIKDQRFISQILL